MTKKLNIKSITNELEESAFFSNRRKPPMSPTPPPVIEEPKPEQLKEPIQKIQIKKSNDDTMIPRHHDTTVSRHHDTIVLFTEENMIELIRKAVKQIGKESATQRLTIEEKQQLRDIEYAYNRQGIKTTGNEIIRIATNFIMMDYQKNGENSILGKVLKKLNS